MAVSRTRFQGRSAVLLRKGAQVRKRSSLSVNFPGFDDQMRPESNRMITTNATNPNPPLG